MKLGFVTAILDSWNYEEMMDFASEQGFECVEVACWPQEKAERRYAGVSHIDAERVNQDDAYAEHIVEYAKKSGVSDQGAGQRGNRKDSFSSFGKQCADGEKRSIYRD